MKKFILAILLVSFELNLTAISADVFKQDSIQFCDILNCNNNLDDSLPKPFLAESSRLMVVIQDMLPSLDDIAKIQERTGTQLNLEQNVIINKHIINLNVIRKMLMHIKNKHPLSNALHKTFDFYRNSMDTHYYELNPSYESYLLQRYNMSIKETNYTILYTLVGLPFVMNSLVGGYKIFDCYNKVSKSVICDATVVLTTGYAMIGAFLMNRAYMSVNNPEYEFELI